MAHSYVATRRMGGATRVLAEAQELMEQHGDVYWEPALFRLSGRLAAAEGRGRTYRGGHRVRGAPFGARERGTHLLELPAATDLAHLQAAQGQPLEARKVLAPIYSLFTDRADMADLQDARAVLAGLDG